MKNSLLGAALPLNRRAFLSSIWSHLLYLVESKIKEQGERHLKLNSGVLQQKQESSMIQLTHNTAAWCWVHQTWVCPGSSCTFHSHLHGCSLCRRHTSASDSQRGQALYALRNLTVFWPLWPLDRTNRGCPTRRESRHLQQVSQKKQLSPHRIPSQGVVVWWKPMRPSF